MESRLVRRLVVLAGAVAVLLVGTGYQPPAEGQTTATADVIPLLDCVDFDPDTQQVTARFGYANPNATAIAIPVGADNFFSPPPSYRGQPTSFQPGTHPSAFSATFELDQTSLLTWNLQGRPVTARNDPTLYCDQTADVGLTQSASPEGAVAGGLLTYTLTVVNKGPQRASGVAVTDPLPGGVQLVSAVPSQGTCAGAETVVCELGALEAPASPFERDSAVVEIAVRPEGAGTLTNTASVASGQPDSDTRNNVATTRISVGSSQDTAAPTVTATQPADGATGVQRGATLTATFSEAMDAATINGSTFMLYRVTSDGTKQITNVAVGLSSDGLKATLDPFGSSATLLAKNTKYSAVVTPGTKDLAGNALDQDPTEAGGQQKAWTFTTGRL